MAATRSRHSAEPGVTGFPRSSSTTRVYRTRRGLATEKRIIVCMFTCPTLKEDPRTPAGARSALSATWRIVTEQSNALVTARTQLAYFRALQDGIAEAVELIKEQGDAADVARGGQ